MRSSFIKTLRILCLPLVCTIFLVARFNQNQSYLQIKATVTSEGIQATVPVDITRTPRPVDNSFLDFNKIINNDTSANGGYPFKRYNPVKPPIFSLKDDTKEYFVGLSNTTCFISGTDVASSNRTCVCLPRWTGTDCSVPESVWASKKFRRKFTNKLITRRSSPGRVINAININHEIDMLEIRLHELYDVVDVFIICESNYTASGDPKPLFLLPKLRKGFLKEFQDKIVYVWLDHFPKGGKENGWIADDYLRTFLWKQGKKQISGLRDDDLFVLTDADEIPHAGVIAFLKNHDGYGEPIFWRLRWNVFGFFWLSAQEHIEVAAACTIKYLREGLRDDAIGVRRGTLPKDADPSYEALVDEWTIGQNRGQNAGWHCSWCTTIEDMKIKLISAQKSDGTRWGDFPEKRTSKYLLSLVKEGKWFDGNSVGIRSPVDDATVPAYVLANAAKFSYMLALPDEVKASRSR